jgi:uncharacterized protein YbjT (DUF2867 family)
VKVILFGATGMVGQGALLECLRDSEVTDVLSVARQSTGKAEAKLKELLVEDFLNLASKGEALAGYDLCLFCLGVSAAGLSEAEYTRITYEYTLAAARAVLAQNPQAAFVYISGQGTNSSEQGGSMWARVKGKTENDLLKLGFRRAYMFRPGAIEPLDGIKSKTTWYRVFYSVLGVFSPLLHKLAPNSITTTRALGIAMLLAAKRDLPSGVFEGKDIRQLR